MLFHQTDKEVFLATREIDIGIREFASQLGLVKMLVTHLFGKFVGETLHLGSYPLVTAIRIQTQVEIATVHVGMGKVALCKDIHLHVFRTEEGIVVINPQVTQRALHLVVLTKIGVDIEMGTPCHNKRLVE